MSRPWLCALMGLASFTGAGCRSTEKPPQDRATDEHPHRYNRGVVLDSNGEPIKNVGRRQDFDGGEEPSLLDAIIRRPNFH